MIGYNFKSELVFYGLEEGESKNITLKQYAEMILPKVKQMKEDMER